MSLPGLLLVLSGLERVDGQGVVALVLLIMALSVVGRRMNNPGL